MIILKVRTVINGSDISRNRDKPLVFRVGELRKNTVIITGNIYSWEVSSYHLAKTIKLSYLNEKNVY